MSQKLSLKSWLGVELAPVSLKEKVASGLGGMIAIYLIIVITRDAIHLSGAAMLIASMGASAVLLFAVPHGALSQPWPVIAGHVIPAFIGVGCAKYIPNTAPAAGCAVGLSIAAMHQFKCIHPPGGATALIAVIGSGVSSLGYSFIWCPVLLNALIMVAIAVLFNSVFPWRRYPASLNRPRQVVNAAPEVTHEEVIAALESIDSFVDITESDLMHLHQLLSRRLGS